MDKKKKVKTILICIIALGIYAIGALYLYKAPYFVYADYNVDNNTYSQLYMVTENDWNEEKIYTVGIRGHKSVIYPNLFSGVYYPSPCSVGVRTDLELWQIRIYKGFVPIDTIPGKQIENAGADDIELRVKNGSVKISNEINEDEQDIICLREFKLQWKRSVLLVWTMLVGITSFGLVLLRWAVRGLLSKAGKYKTIFNRAAGREGSIKRFYILCSGYLEKNPHKFIYLVIISFLFLIIILFGRYLIAEKYWIFTGIASDSYGQIFPVYYNIARRIEEGRNCVGWDFLNGLGNGIGRTIVDLNSWILFFGKENVAYLMILSHISKIFFAGLAFYGYLRVIGRTRATSLIFSIGYAFCGHMVIRGRWENMPREVLIIAIMLLCLELYIMKNDLRWLPLAVVVFALNMSSYSTILYGIVFTGYAVFRYFMEREFEVKDFLKYISGLAFCILLVVPVIIWNIEGIVAGLNSSRFKNGVNNYSALVSKKNEWFVSLGNIQSAFFRTIGVSIAGVEIVDFSGVINVLEDPTFYCGISTLVALPLAVRKENKKKKYWYLAAFAVAGLYFFINPIRFMASGMAGSGSSGSSTFKLSSFWIIVLFLYIGSEGLDCVWNKKSTLKRVHIVSGVLLAISLILAFVINPSISWSYFLCSCIFIALYGFLFECFLRQESKEKQNVLKTIICFVCLCEIIACTYGYINTPKALENDNSRSGLEDYSIEALAYIEDLNDSNAYRIDKQYESYGMCDALYQDYMGIQSYIGGLGNREEIVEFYESLNLPRIGTSGLLKTTISDEANTLMGVKYALSKVEMISNYGYQYKNSEEDVLIYENKYALPMVYGYEKYIKREDFEKLSVQEKRDVILKYCVVETDRQEKALDNYQGQTVDKMHLLDEYSISWLQLGEKVFFPANRKGDALVMRIESDNQSENMKKNYVEYSDNEGNKNKMYIGIPAGQEEQLIVINQEDVCKVEFLIEGDIDIKVLEVAQVPQEVYYDYYRECISGLKEINAENIDIDNRKNSISGSIDIQKPTEICFAVPYAKEWKLYLNGEEVETEKINIGFIGALLEEGEYEFELKYSLEEDRTKEYFKWFGCFLVVVNFFIYTIYIKRSKKREEKRS